MSWWCFKKTGKVNLIDLKRKQARSSADTRVPDTEFNCESNNFCFFNGWFSSTCVFSNFSNFYLNWNYFGFIFIIYKLSGSDFVQLPLFIGVKRVDSCYIGNLTLNECISRSVIIKFNAISCFGVAGDAKALILKTLWQLFGCLSTSFIGSVTTRKNWIFDWKLAFDWNLTGSFILI